ncbi:MAG TPA: efflux RND transporter permease subunit, partial [Phycisphaerales bacterium]|nr:efflux RND transporter permease subunit [Phycisphaerales bacterium]
MTGWRAWSLRPVIIGVLAAASVVGAAKMAPPLDYLPTGNRNLVFGGLIIPPGYNVAQMTSIAERLEEKLGAYVKAGSDPALLATLPPIPQMPMPGAPLFDPVGIDNFFIGSFGGGMFVGATSAEEQRVIPIGSLLTNAMNSIPGAYGGASQASIFGRGAGGGNTVNVEISGPRLERVTAAAQMIFGIAGGKYGFGRSVTADPNNFNLSQPETRLRLNARGRELGLTTRDAGEAVRALFDGAFVDDFRLGGETVDMVVLPLGGRKPGRLDYREQLASIPVATPSGRVVPLDTVVDVVQSEAPPQISRSEELPSVSVRVRPPQGMTVEDVMVELERDVVGAARQAGLIDQSMRVRLEGTAASLDEVRASLFGATDPRATVTGWRRGVIYVSWGLAALGVLAGVWVLVRSARMGRGAGVYGAIGVALLAVVIAGLLGGLAWQPQLATARFIWALAVTYLLMCAIFESFLYPLVIMVSVPLAMVGGFGGLAIVHEVTRRDLTQPTQNLDVLTMLGFVILIGTVVNNAILIVEQSLNFMDPARYGSADPPMPRLTAIREALRSRVRPVMMTTATTVGGMLPLVVAPGAGSEMYRGLGAVVLGGLIVSTIFTLVLVPLAFSLVLDMSESARAALSLGSGVAPGGRGGLPGGPAERNGAAPARRAVPVSESPPA